MPETSLQTSGKCSFAASPAKKIIASATTLLFVKNEIPKLLVNN